MNSPTILSNLPGAWSGRKFLWMSPEDPERVSACSVQVSTAVKNQALCVQYSWTFDATPHEGLLVIGFSGQSNEIEAILMDSFHTGSRFMPFKGRLQADGAVTLLGSYPAPEGPDWGWRIFVDPGSSEVFRIAMYNIPPGSEEIPAVSMELTRRSIP